MQQTKITLTPNLAKKELIIGVQAGDRGRLLLAHVPSLQKREQTIVSGLRGDDMFVHAIETALSGYVPRPHHVYMLLERLAKRG